MTHTSIPTLDRALREARKKRHYKRLESFRAYSTLIYAAHPGSNLKVSVGPHTLSAEQSTAETLGASARAESNVNLGEPPQPKAFVSNCPVSLRIRCFPPPLVPPPESCMVLLVTIAFTSRIHSRQREATIAEQRWIAMHGARDAPGVHVGAPLFSPTPQWRMFATTGKSFPSTPATGHHDRR